MLFRSKTVNQPVRKKDAMQLVTGQPVYMDDVIPVSYTHLIAAHGAGRVFKRFKEI